MGMTTMKIDSRVRDRLAEVARQEEVTLGVMVDRLLRSWEEQEVLAAYERLQADPEEWASHQAEHEEFEQAALTDFNARMAAE